MAKYNRFEDLECYQLAIALTKEFHRLYKKKELKNEYEFRSQLFAALISITNNISEGFEYNNNVDFIRFLRYAKGSTGESRNVLNVIKACELITNEEYAPLYKDLTLLSKQIKGLMNYIQKYEKDKKIKSKDANL